MKDYKFSNRGYKLIYGEYKWIKFYFFTGSNNVYYADDGEMYLHETDEGLRFYSFHSLIEYLEALGIDILKEIDWEEEI